MPNNIRIGDIGYRAEAVFNPEVHNRVMWCAKAVWRVSPVSIPGLEPIASEEIGYYTAAVFNSPEEAIASLRGALHQYGKEAPTVQENSNGPAPIDREPNPPPAPPPKNANRCCKSCWCASPTECINTKQCTTNTEKQRESIINSLNDALELDHNSIFDLIKTRKVCNFKLVSHPTIPVTDVTPNAPMVSVLGLINGILVSAGILKITAMYIENRVGDMKLRGFV